MRESRRIDVVLDDDLDQLSRCEIDCHDAWCYGFFVGGLFVSILHVVVYCLIEFMSNS